MRVEGAESLLRLNREGQKQGAARRLDHDVGERQRLHDRVDRRRAQRDVEEVRRDPAPDIADAEQQHVGRGLHHDEADDLMDQMMAGDHSVEPDGQDPGGHEEREELHQCLPCLTMSVCSSSSPMMRMNAAATSIPTKKLISAIVPEELTAPGTVPSGRKLARYGIPRTTAVSPTAAKPPAPAAPTASIRLTGLILRKTRNSPDR